ncbi:MAG: imidazolonepropionase [Pyrinomonadaceae bacterium]
MEKKKVDLLVGNTSEVVTCKSGGYALKGEAMREANVFKEAWFAIDRGMIVALGTQSDIDSRFESDSFVDAGGMSIIPGFVESHTHLVFAGNRINEFELKIRGAEYLEILQAGGGIHSTVKATRDASEQSLFERASSNLQLLRRAGVTACEVKTGYGLDTESELKMLRVIKRLASEFEMTVIPTFLPAHAIPIEMKNRDDEYTELICSEMIPKALSEWGEIEYKLRGAVNGIFIDVFCEKGAFSLAQSKRVIETASNLGFGIKAHVDEFTNLGCAGYAIEKGAVSIDHLDHTSDREIRMLSESNTVGVVTPGVNFNLGSCDFADARKLIDYGCAVALSTDYNPGSSPCPSPSMIMAIACRYQKLLPSEALNAFTINGAAALGAESFLGSLEEGKFADFLILETDDFREICYEFGSNPVRAAFRKGIAI